MAEFELQPQPLKMDEPLTGENLKNLKNMQIGSGSTQFNAGKDGIFLGADNFADAPFSVDMEGSCIADKFTDKTYGFYGVLVKQVKTTDFVSNPVALPIYKADGVTKITTGLLSVYANWFSSATGRLNFLPGINNSTGTSYWSIQKDGSGFYEIRHLGGNQASELPSPGYVIYTCLFNSNETTYF